MSAAVTLAPPRAERTSAALRRTAQTISEGISTGVYAALSADQRLDLRGVTLALAEWAEQVRDMEDALGAVRRIVTRGAGAQR